MLDSFFNPIFGGLIKATPLGAILIISLLITFIVTIVYKYATNQKRLKEVKMEMDGLRKEMNENKNNQEKLMQIQKQSMEKSFEQLKHQLKPMLITMIPLLLMFSWLRNVYTPYGHLIWVLDWLWIYIISSIIFSTVLRKVLKVY